MINLILEVLRMKGSVILHFFNKELNLTAIDAKRQLWKVNRWGGFIHRPRPQWGLILVLEGQLDYLWSNGSLSLSPGDLAFLPKGCRYDVRFRTERSRVESLIVNFQTDDTFKPMPLLLASNCTLLYKELFEQIIDAYDRSQPHLLKSRLYLLIHQILQSQKGQEEALLDQAILLLEQELPIGEIAYQCRISESGLRRLFAKQFGVSPVAYRTQLKIQKACRLLISTDLTIGEIADTLNFFDEAYFCKIFRKQTGLSPTCYRNENQIIL